MDLTGGYVAMPFVVRGSPHTLRSAEPLGICFCFFEGAAGGAGAVGLGRQEVPGIHGRASGLSAKKATTANSDERGIYDLHQVILVVLAVILAIAVAVALAVGAVVVVVS